MRAKFPLGIEPSFEDHVPWVTAFFRLVVSMNEQLRRFDPGDVVRLSKGGPWMIVVATRRNGEVETMFIEDGRPTYDGFHPARLTLFMEACSKARQA